MNSTDVSRIGIACAERKLASRLGENYLVYRDRWSAAGRKNPDLVHLDVELTDSCNQRCIMCPRNRDFHPTLEYELNTGEALSLNLFRKVLRELVPLGLCSINFGGFAEPLIIKDWDQFVEVSHAEGIIDTRLITNGLLLGNNIDKIFSSQLRNLYVSVDATSAETYSSIRGHGYKRVTDGLKRFMEERALRQSALPIVRVSFVVLDKNEHEVEQFVSLWKDLVDHIDIQRKFDYARKVVDGPKRWDCDQPWKRLSLLANGDIIPCCSFNGRSLKIGNAATDDVAEIWRGEVLDGLRISLQRDEIPTCNVCQSNVI